MRDVGKKERVRGKNYLKGQKKRQSYDFWFQIRLFYGILLDGELTIDE